MSKEIMLNWSNNTQQGLYQKLKLRYHFFLKWVIGWEEVRFYSNDIVDTCRQNKYSKHHVEFIIKT